MINWRTLIHVLSFVVIIVALFMLVPMLVAYLYGEWGCFWDFGITLTGTMVISGLIFLFTRGQGEFRFTTRDGFLLVSLSWIVVSAVGALPFVFSGSIPSYTEAYFETMSGFSTTGASILTAIESQPYSILFWRSLTHWLGGMGIVVLAVAVLPLIGIGGMPLIQAEFPGPRVDKIVPKVRETAKILWMIYLGLTILETGLLLLGGMNLFDSLTHTFGTMATGGFSPRNASVGAYSSPYLQNVITLFMVLAGLNFGLYYILLQRDFKSLWKNSEFKAYLGIFLAASLLIAFNLQNQGVFSGFGKSLRYSGFQVASILTTTGYATDNFDAWPFFSRAVLFTLMFIGGCSGSTGGGIKVIRIISIFKLAFNEMKHLLNPRGVYVIRMNGSPMKKDMIYTIVGFFFLYIFLLLIITLAVAFSGVDLLSSLSTALVTLGNIGPGFGAVGPSLNFHFLHPAIKWLLSLAMMIGRLEVYTVLVILTPTFWKK
ncbi:MAG: TrkH family potassium uptake protein [Spirochaetaceae bacterium]|jgi:trk system potassium uptake protein TrkH|nr:TrkH family potassium uptake protein [Spirochaetaceae bacterium]